MDENNFTETDVNILDSDRYIDTDNNFNSLVAENSVTKSEKAYCSE